jgi:peptidoglycan-N-acetylglucosamine deacetylase
LNLRLLPVLAVALLLPLTSSVSMPARAASGCPTPASSVLTRAGTGSAKTVALTFDDGPGPHTGAILDVLARRGVHATFFVTGAHVAARPRLARRIVAEGHQIANHTYSHPQRIAGSRPYGYFDELARHGQRRQVDRTTAAIEAATGTRPCLFRGPGGHHFATWTQAMVRERRMSTVHWSVESGDWAQPGRVTERATARIRDAAIVTDRHAIVLLHDAKASSEPDGRTSPFRGNTVAALPGIIRFYKSRRYAFTDPYGRAFR